MNEPASCPHCGALLPAGGPCPSCLLIAGMDAETVPSGAADIPDSMPADGPRSCTSPQQPEPSTTAAPREALGTMIGRYKLLQEIGEGGFGIVYMADQMEPVKRRVALKVLKPGMDTREVVARFEAERQALALMDHPNIAQVYDGGATESGRPCFVMELVKGMPLTKYCDDHQLTTRQRLDLFLDVLSAVQHAHQKGIIHRDLKPSNILVSPHDGKPVIKVIDFGIAKALSMELTSRTLFTGLGQMIGTPQYMSPEQAETNALDVDDPDAIAIVGYARPESHAALKWSEANRQPRLLLSESQEIDHPRVWWKEAIIFSTFYTGYTLVRNQFGSALVDGVDIPFHAFNNAIRVIEIERWLGLYHEESIQDLFLPHLWLIKLMNAYYGSAHFFVTLTGF